MRTRIRPEDTFLFGVRFSYHGNRYYCNKKLIWRVVKGLVSIIQNNEFIFADSWQSGYMHRKTAAFLDAHQDEIDDIIGAVVQVKNFVKIDIDENCFTDPHHLVAIFVTKYKGHSVYAKIFLTLSCADVIIRNKTLLDIHTEMEND